VKKKREKKKKGRRYRAYDFSDALTRPRRREEKREKRRRQGGDAARHLFPYQSTSLDLGSQGKEETSATVAGTLHPFLSSPQAVA